MQSARIKKNMYCRVAFTFRDKCSPVEKVDRETSRIFDLRYVTLIYIWIGCLARRPRYIRSKEEKEKGRRRMGGLEIARDREERVTSPVARSHRKLIDVWLRLPARVLTRQYKYLSSSPCAFTHSVRCIKAPIVLSAHIDALILIGALRSTRNIFMADENVYAGGWINI